MAEASPSGKHQASANATQTTAIEFSILLFNVSSKTAAGMAEAQKEGIKLVLESKDLKLNKFSTFIFCSDGLTDKKKTDFCNKLKTSPRTRDKNAAIFYNETAETEFSPEYVHEIPVLPLHLEHRKQKQKARELIQKVENFVNEWIGKKEIVGDQLLKDAQLHCQNAMSLLDLSPLRDPSYQSSQEFRDDCLGRVAVTKIASPHSDRQPSRQILLASWHGPHQKKKKEERLKYLQMLIHFIEDLRKYYHMDVVVLGGDFNLDADFVRQNIDTLQSERQDITLFSFLAEKLMYMVVWPANCLEKQPGFPKEIHPKFPTVTVDGEQLEPFDHRILLYRFVIKLPETKETEKTERERERERERGERGRHMMWRQRKEEQ